MDFTLDADLVDRLEHAITAIYMFIFLIGITLVFKTRVSIPALINISVICTVILIAQITFYRDFITHGRYEFYLMYYAPLLILTIFLPCFCIRKFRKTTHRKIGLIFMTFMAASLLLVCQGTQMWLQNSLNYYAAEEAQEVIAAINEPGGLARYCAPRGRWCEIKTDYPEAYFKGHRPYETALHGGVSLMDPAHTGDDIPVKWELRSVYIDNGLYIAFVMNDTFYRMYTLGPSTGHYTTISGMALILIILLFLTAVASSLYTALKPTKCRKRSTVDACGMFE